MCREQLPGKQCECMFEQTVRLQHLLFLPQGYDPASNQKWPLIVYLHGIRERGSNLELLKKHGIPKIVEEKPDLPFIAVSPQCSAESFWWEHHWTLKKMLEDILSRYAIDAHKVYLTGNSMGGFGTWNLACTYPGMFAAIAPICGGGFPELACKLKNVPVWSFHGSEDNVVMLEVNRRMVNALRASGGNVHFTVYPDVGHDSWTQTYDDPKLYEWFLKHGRKVS